MCIDAKMRIDSDVFHGGRGSARGFQFNQMHWKKSHRMRITKNINEDHYLTPLCPTAPLPTGQGWTGRNIPCTLPFPKDRTWRTHSGLLARGGGIKADTHDRKHICLIGAWHWDPPAKRIIVLGQNNFWCSIENDGMVMAWCDEV